MWTKKRGNVNELKCLTKMAELGFAVLMPYGDSERYDFVIEKNGRFFRIQSKPWAYTTTNGSIAITTSSSRKTSSGTKKTYYTEDEIDFFSTMFNDRCYLIPVKLGAGKNNISFRIENPIVNGRKCNILSDYEAEKVMAEYIEDGIEKIYDASKIKRSTLPCKCIDCGAEIRSGRKRCKKCELKMRSKLWHINRDEFERDVRYHSYKYAIEKYKVSYPTIKKWIKNFGIDLTREEHMGVMAKIRRDGRPYRNRKVRQYDKSGLLIKEFDSLWSVKDELGFGIDRVKRCCDGWRKSHKGFIWKYADDDLMDRGRTGYAPDFEIGVAPQKCDDENGANSTNSARADNDELSGDKPKCVETIHPAPDCTQG